MWSSSILSLICEAFMKKAIWQTKSCSPAKNASQCTFYDCVLLLSVTGTRYVRALHLMEINEWTTKEAELGCWRLEKLGGTIVLMLFWYIIVLIQFIKAENLCLMFLMNDANLLFKQKQTKTGIFSSNFHQFQAKIESSYFSFNVFFLMLVETLHDFFTLGST